MTEAGIGFTWAVNSGENRLTPWSNDPVSDPSAEAIFVRDDATGQCWTPTPGPLPRRLGSEVLVRRPELSRLAPG